MSLTVIMGAFWGDEGKAKIVDYLAENIDVIVRFQGGCNAGHTVVHRGTKYIQHILPIGILRKGVKCVIGNGVVIDPFQMSEEIKEIQKKGISINKRLYISSQAHLTLPLHRFIDGLNEKIRGKSSLGTTKSGIGPTYSDKSLRVGIRVSDLLYPDYFKDRFDNILKIKQYQIPDWIESNDMEEIKKKILKIGDMINPYIVDTPHLINQFIDEDKDILFEGAQGTLLDIDFGTYPYVTSSNPSIGGALIGTGINPYKIDKIIGVMKAYFTRVGKGPFPTELHTEQGDYIREKGKEFGATTGRPRRCGWFDCVAAKYSLMINGFDEIALTKLDVYSGMENIKICTQYRIKGKITSEFPSNVIQLDEVTPEYEILPGWKENISRIKNFEKLPANTKNFIKKIEELLNVKVKMISVSPERKDIIIN